MNSIKNYVLPSTTDEEGNEVIFTVDQTTSGLPTFVAFDDSTKTFTFSPTQIIEKGTFNIRVNISDGYPLKNTYSFILTVIK